MQVGVIEVDFILKDLNCIYVCRYQAVSFVGELSNPVILTWQLLAQQ